MRCPFEVEVEDEGVRGHAGQLCALHSSLAEERGRGVYGFEVVEER